MSFTNLIEVLGIIEGTNSGENDIDSAEVTDQDALTLSDVTVSEETKKFVADVESIEFSNPELVWVGKVETDSTVGGPYRDPGDIGKDNESVYSVKTDETSSVRR